MKVLFSSKSSPATPINGHPARTFSTHLVSSFNFRLLMQNSDCSSSLEDARCMREMQTLHNDSFISSAFYFNGSCYANGDAEMAAIRRAFFHKQSAMSPAEEFFESVFQFPFAQDDLNIICRNYVLEKVQTIDTFGGLNFKLVAAYFLAWATTALVLFRGVKLMGVVAYFTATVPYVSGIYLYLTSAIYIAKIWQNMRQFKYTHFWVESWILFVQICQFLAAHCVVETIIVWGWWW